jgi:hypothetical protein
VTEIIHFPQIQARKTIYVTEIIHFPQIQARKTIYVTIEKAYQRPFSLIMEAFGH